MKPQYWILSLFILLAVIQPSFAAPIPDDQKIIHLINRLSFGPRPGEIERVKSLGIDGYIKEQISPEYIPESASLTSKLAQLVTVNMNPVQLKQYAEAPPKPTPDARKAADKNARQVLDEAIKSRLLRASLSNRQLQEVMVDFWYNHFNVDVSKGSDRYWVGAYEQEAIRPHALGRFRDLLGATAHNPAMLFYLDNWQNSAPNHPDPRRKYQSVNENYAREIMELHTLGVDGGYTQQDVVSLAKILTGWGLSRSNQHVNNDSGFYFDPKRHDMTDKVFLGHTIKGSGQAEGEEALDILARNPGTAHYISYKLAQYFVGDNPPVALVKRMTQRYLVSDGYIRDVLETLFHSDEFWDAKNLNNKFKTPYQYAVSAVRATGIDIDNTKPLSDLLQQLAMPLYGCPTPDGYKNTQDIWLNPDSVLRRLSFVTEMANGRLPLVTQPVDQNKDNPQMNAMLSTDMLSRLKNPAPAVKPQPIPVDAGQLKATLGDIFSAKTKSAIASSPPQMQAELILGSPEFMRH